MYYVAIAIFSSGRCQRECLGGFIDYFDRWAHLACGMCCIDDVDDNGYITEEDMTQHHADLCGRDQTLMKCGCILHFVFHKTFQRAIQRHW